MSSRFGPADHPGGTREPRADREVRVARDQRGDQRQQRGQVRGQVDVAVRQDLRVGDRPRRAQCMAAALRRQVHHPDLRQLGGEAFGQGERAVRRGVVGDGHPRREGHLGGQMCADGAHRGLQAGDLVEDGDHQVQDRASLVDGAITLGPGVDGAEGSAWCRRHARRLPARPRGEPPPTLCVACASGPPTSRPARRGRPHAPRARPEVDLALVQTRPASQVAPVTTSTTTVWAASIPMLNAARACTWWWLKGEAVEAVGEPQAVHQPEDRLEPRPDPVALSAQRHRGCGVERHRGRALPVQPTGDGAVRTGHQRGRSLRHRHKDATICWTVPARSPPNVLPRPHRLGPHLLGHL